MPPIRSAPCAAHSSDQIQPVRGRYSNFSDPSYDPDMPTIAELAGDPLFKATFGWMPWLPRSAYAIGPDGVARFARHPWADLRNATLGWKPGMPKYGPTYKSDGASTVSTHSDVGSVDTNLGRVPGMPKSTSVLGLDGAKLVKHSGSVPQIVIGRIPHWTRRIADPKAREAIFKMSQKYERANASTWSGQNRHFPQYIDHGNSPSHVCTQRPLMLGSVAPEQPAARLEEASIGRRHRPYRQRRLTPKSEH